MINRCEVSCVSPMCEAEPAADDAVSKQADQDLIDLLPA